MPKAKPVSDAPTWAAKLNRRERRFVEEYVIDLNASAALRRSGCYSTKNPDVDAHVILRRPKVAEAIGTLVAERSGATRSRVIEELGKIAFADVHDIPYVKDGVVQVKNTDELTPEQRAVVAGYETERGFVTVKLHDKIRALDLLSKILGMKRSVNAETPAVTVNIQKTSPTPAIASWRASRPCWHPVKPHCQRRPNNRSKSNCSRSRILKMRELSKAEQVSALPDAEREAFWAALSPDDRAALEFEWGFWGRPEQIPPMNKPWRTFLFLAGRGAGKTRAAAEWIRACMTGPKPKYRHAAIIAETAADARDVCVGDTKECSNPSVAAFFRSVRNKICRYMKHRSAVY
jgi:phage terminase small subunit